ncbi:hypothetical protein RA27_15480 [Ruegeria sp. ANG-R]|uniref:DUF1826 domain-containing protein n=1 Tax=Ruegeria sp. ANG-R TaxID=1577903 RepID=UPI00057CBBBE|nr:DUF1826 domain-containing protein [Ruegeria sp. ANG-R]KIC40217.1 hypothetical protein RA27_15480 [Ruegeria sp. ANG-R]
MTFAQTEVRDAAIGVGIADKPSDLAAIYKPGCAATIWRRQPPKGFQDWIDGLHPDQLPTTRTVLRGEAVGEAVQHICDIAGMDECTERTWLVEDIADLSVRFAEIMRSPYLRLRLGVVNTNACRKFHIDAIMARLICTYRGTGTQYGVSTDGKEPKKVFTVATGTPMVMRGTLWPESPASGLLHRSPPIEGSGETRLVLVLDPVFDMDDA